MPNLVHIAEDYSIRALSGDAVLSRLVLTGWGAMDNGMPALEAFTDRGRLWWRFTAATNLLEFFRRSTLLPADRVAYTDDAAADGKAVLVADNASGLSGGADISGATPGQNPTADADGDVIISYAHENDLRNEFAGVEGFLDEDNTWYESGTRFEAILRAAKRELDEHILHKLGGDAQRDSAGRRLLAQISDPRQLAAVHAQYCIYKLEAHRGTGDQTRIDAAQWQMDRALSLLRAVSIGLDREADAVIDVEKRSADRTLARA